MLPVSRSVFRIRVLHTADTSLRAVPSADDDRAALLRLLQALPPTATEQRTCRSRVVPARHPARSRLHLAATRNVLFWFKL